MQVAPCFDEIKYILYSVNEKHDFFKTNITKESTYDVIHDECIIVSVFNTATTLKEKLEVQTLNILVKQNIWHQIVCYDT